MRDPDRIDKICEDLATVWKEVPDWRLGQLFANFIRSYGDIFYLRDDKIIEKLEEYLIEATKRPLAYYKPKYNISVVIDEIQTKENYVMAKINDGIPKGYNIRTENDEPYFVIEDIKVPLNECTMLY